MRLECEAAKLKSSFGHEFVIKKKEFLDGLDVSITFFAGRKDSQS